MDRAQAEAILDGDRETALAQLMRIDELIEANRRLEARVAELEQVDEVVDHWPKRCPRCRHRF